MATKITVETNVVSDPNAPITKVITRPKPCQYDGVYVTPEGKTLPVEMDVNGLPITDEQKKDPSKRFKRYIEPEAQIHYVSEMVAFMVSVNPGGKSAFCTAFGQPFWVPDVFERFKTRLANVFVGTNLQNRKYEFTIIRHNTGGSNSQLDETQFTVVW